MIFDIITTPTLQYKGCTHSRILYRTVVWEMVEVGWGGGDLSSQAMLGEMFQGFLCFTCMQAAPKLYQAILVIPLTH